MPAILILEITTEFIPLSFWYDAPLTSPYSDRRHDPWLVYGSPSCSPVRWSSWISRAVTLDEFQQLVPPFEAVFQCHMAVWRMDGKPRTARRFPVYKNCPLPTPEDRLFNWLQVFKRAPTALLGSGGGPEHRTRLVPSEKCAVSWGSDDDEMRMITARFVRAIERFAGDLCWHFIPLFQQVVEIRKTRNQLFA